jgi:AbrB family looped-hinge helix DNA binding protein
MKSTVSEKGQVTIPKPLRKKLGIGAGQVLDFEAKNGTLVARKARGARAPVDAVYGILSHLHIDVDKELERMRGPGWREKKDTPHAKRR